jgi:hypothetical protein
MAKLVAAGRISKQEWHYKWKVEGRVGSKNDDHSALPLDHPPIEKLLNPIHYIKN